jgi:hypothetical protein
LICTLRIHGYITGGVCCLDIESIDVTNSESVVDGGGVDDEPVGTIEDEDGGGGGGGLIDKP